MATFHPFPRLPLEIRMQIWAFAFEDDRVLKVRWRGRNDYWSASPVPAVTRASRESRKYCSYQKAFVDDGSSHYIWSKFDSDIIQIRGPMISVLTEEDGLEKNEIRRLRIELVDKYGHEETEWFFHDYSHKILYFPKLNGVDILVPDGLRNWGSLIEENYWGACPKKNVRIVDANTGEWIDEQTAASYLDWADNSQSLPSYSDWVENRQRVDVENIWYTRIQEWWDEEDEEHEEDVVNRYKAMMEMQKPLPRIDLNY